MNMYVGNLWVGVKLHECMSGDEVMSGKSDLLLMMSQEGDENNEFTN